MMCLKVSSNIHPTSAPTGTADDMAGKDKADALIDQNRRKLRRSALQTRQIQPVLTFYDISRAGLHLYGTLKTPSKCEVWPNGGTRRDICR
jgi:hypothetical protein